MRKNLDLEHCVDREEAVISACWDELEQNQRKIAEGAWATGLDLSPIKYWYPLLMTYCPNHPLAKDTPPSFGAMACNLK